MSWVGVHSIERRAAFVSGFVHRSARLHQQPRHPLVAVSGCDVERRAAFVSGFVHRSATPKPQNPYNVKFSGIKYEFRYYL
jgi:hypothetical protein